MLEHRLHGSNVKCLTSIMMVRVRLGYCLVAVIFQCLFLADFIAVIGLYSQCQKVSFFPNFWMKIPNFKSEKNSKKIHHFYRGKSWLKTVEYSTVHSLI